MKQKTILKLTSTAIALLISIPSFAAPSRRRAAAPVADVPPTLATLTGTVTDADSGAPVVFADVNANTGHAVTDAAGKFAFNVLSAPKDVTVTVSRSGYETVSRTVSVVVGSKNVLDLKLKGKPTVTLRESDGTTHSLDADSVQFAYLIPLSGYAPAQYANFCKTDGTTYNPPREDFVRITGPAKSVNFSPCCTIGPVMSITVQTKSAGSQNVYFVDSCYGYEVDLIGRDHVSGSFTYYNFAKIAEVVFP